MVQSAVNQERFDRLRKLNPLQAVQAWINGDFGMDEEPALIEAFRKNPLIRWSDDEICDIMMAAMDEELTASQAFERLTRATRFFPPSDLADEELI